MKLIRLLGMASILALPSQAFPINTYTSLKPSNSKPQTALNVADTDAWASYTRALITDPYSTKMATGVVMAVLGDYIAQRRDIYYEYYDAERAVSFAAFGACYGFLQEYIYPPSVMASCQGEFSFRFLSSIGLKSLASDAYLSLGPLEMTIVSQLIIVPTLYYPVFYAVTGAVQGLTFNESLRRAEDTFGSIMKRHLMYWIPLQFFTLAFVPRDGQLPLLLLFGLIWTVILSNLMGYAKYFSSYYYDGNYGGDGWYQDDGYYQVGNYYQDDEYYQDSSNYRGGGYYKPNSRSSQQRRSNYYSSSYSPTTTDTSDRYSSRNRFYLPQARPKGTDTIPVDTEQADSWVENRRGTSDIATSTSNTSYDDYTSKNNRFYLPQTRPKGSDTMPVYTAQSESWFEDRRGGTVDQEDIIDPDRAERSFRDFEGRGYRYYQGSGRRGGGFRGRRRENRWSRGDRNGYRDGGRGGGYRR